MEKAIDKNSRLERIRVIACLLVITNHIQGAPVVENGIFFAGRESLIVLTQTSIQMFLMISGFLMFCNTGNHLEELWGTYWHRIKKFLLYLFLPSLVIVVVSAVFYGFIVDGKTMPEVFAERNFQWFYIKDYIFLQQSDYICVHLWYVWEYAKIIVFFPLLAFLCQDTKDKNRIRRLFMTASAANTIFVDARSFLGIPKGNFDSLTMNKYILFVLIGYELYLLFLQREINWMRVRIVGAALFCVALAGDIVLQSWYFERTGTTYMAATILGCAGVGNFLFLFSFQESGLSAVWNWLGKRTLYIYLVHVIVIFTGENVWDRFFWEIAGAGKSMLSLLVYSFGYGAVIFALSLVTGMLFAVVYEKIFLTIGGKFLFQIGRKILFGIEKRGKESNEKQRFVGNTNAE